MAKIEFNLKKLVQVYNIPEMLLASVMFPNNKHPTLSFKAIEDNPQKVTIKQLSDITEFLGVALMDIIEVDGILPAEEQEITTFKIDGHWVYFNHESKILAVQKIGEPLAKYTDNYIIDGKVSVSSFLQTVKEIIDNI